MGEKRTAWYHGVTRYQWLVLVIASLGWVFDIFEGQIFVASMNEAMPALLPAEIRQLDDTARRGYLAVYNNITFAAFLVGGALGGVGFGILSDRLGRKKTMTLTIVVYSLFTFVSALAQTWWQMAIFRFLVALGVGGEWAVASALVAEVFPRRARAWSLAIFHASSVLGTYLAIAAGVGIVAHPDIRLTLPEALGGEWELTGWRLGFMLGILPALLIIWIRSSLREPESWKQAQSQAAQGIGKKLGGFSELFAADLRLRTILGVGLAAIGLATFWGVHIYGKDSLRQAVERDYREANPENAREALRANAATIKRSEMLGMFLVTTGGGLGLLSFGPLCERWGRRGAFLLFHLGGLVASLVLFQLLTATIAIEFFLPVFGFLTLGMHAGYAVYFPELFPTRLRGTGGGFCFNVGRILAAPVLFISGWLQKDWHFALADAASLLSLLFLVGAVLLIWAPETRGCELPE